MNDTFDFRVLELAHPLPLEEVGRLLAASGIPGQFAPLGPRGARFIPEDMTRPAVYFGPDGRTLEVVTKDLDLVEVEDFLCLLARALDCPIHSQHLEFC